MTNDTAPSIEERRQRLRQVAWPLALLFILIRTALGFWLNVPSAAANSPASVSVESSDMQMRVAGGIPGSRIEAIALAAETRTMPITSTAELTPPPTIQTDCLRPKESLNFGNPDGKIQSIAPGNCLFIELPKVLHKDGTPNYDFVFYEAYAPSSRDHINLDWVEFEVSEDGLSWQPLFVWDQNPGSGSDSSIAKYGEKGVPENFRIQTAELYGDAYRTGVLIDVDSAERVQARVVRKREPPVDVLRWCVPKPHQSPIHRRFA